MTQKEMTMKILEANSKMIATEECANALSDVISKIIEAHRHDNDFAEEIRALIALRDEMTAKKIAYYTEKISYDLKTADDYILSDVEKLVFGG